MKIGENEIRLIDGFIKTAQFAFDNKLIDERDLQGCIKFFNIMKGED